jgi:hypothetical protein
MSVDPNFEIVDLLMHIASKNKRFSEKVCIDTAH